MPDVKVKYTQPPRKWDPHDWYRPRITFWWVVFLVGCISIPIGGFKPHQILFVEGEWYALSAFYSELIAVSIMLIATFVAVQGNSREFHRVKVGTIILNWIIVLIFPGPLVFVAPLLVIIMGIGLLLLFMSSS